jgi:threonyl-tRNA synthetase
VIPVAPNFEGYAAEVASVLAAAGFRASADVDNDRMNAKIRKYQGIKVPYQLVVGQKEMDEKAVAVRFRDGRQQTMKTDEFVSYLKGKIDAKAIEL